jgi:hypothetical protein
VLIDGDHGRERVQPGAWIVDPHLPGARRVEHAAVREDGEADRLARVVVQRDLLETRRRRKVLSRGD